MEQAHWLKRRLTSLRAARSATSSEARLIHYDLAGRYGLKAGSEETRAIDLADTLPGAINGTRSMDENND